MVPSQSCTSTHSRQQQTYTEETHSIGHDADGYLMTVTHQICTDGTLGQHQCALRHQKYFYVGET